MSTSNSSNNQNDYLENNINNEEEDSVDEEYIDPIDLSIIEDENWKPTEAQLNGYMNQLKFELDYKPEEVKKIAYDYLTKELPSGWRRAFFKVNHNVLYIEGETNEIHLVTDIEEKAKEEYDKLRAMKTSDLFYPQNLIQSHNNNIVKSDIHIDNNKEDIKKIDDLVKKKKDNYNKNDSDDYSFDIDDIPDYKKDEIDIDFLNNNKNENNDDNDLKNLKKFYVDRAKSELRIYKEVLKKKYLKEKKEFYVTLEELYEKKNILEKRKLQDNIINLNKELIERYEEDLFDKNEIELNEYEKKIKSEFENNFKNNNNNENNYEIDVLEIKKQSLISQIKIQKQKNENLKEQKKNDLKKLNENKNTLLNDKKKIIKNNHQLQLEKIENEYKKTFENYKKEIENSIKNENLKKKNDEFNNQEYNIKDILKDYQLILDDNFEIKKNLLKKELEEKKNVELEDFKLKQEKDFQSQKNLIQNQQSNLEKEYYEEINELRNKNKKDLDLNNNLFYNKFNNSEFTFDSVKKKISESLKKTFIDIIENINQLLRNENVENEENLKKLEKKIESFLFEYLGKEKIQLNNKKFVYDICEQDYKLNKLKTNYFLDLTNYIIKTIIDNPLNNIEIGDKNEQIKINNILQFGKDKINDYRTKYLNEMSQKLFPQLELSIMKLDGIINDKKIIEDTTILKNNNMNLYNQTNLNSVSESQNMFNSNYNMQINQPSFILPKNNNNMESTLRTNKQINNSETNIKKEFKLNPQNYNNKQEDLRYYNNRNYMNNTNTINNNTYNNLNVFNNSNSDDYENKTLNNNLLETKQNIIYNNYIQQLPDLPQDIVKNLSENDFKLYSQIMDFLHDEFTYLYKELNILQSEKNAHEQISQINEKGHFLHLTKIFDNEKLKTNQNELYLNNKLNTFTLIKNHTQETFNFITNNSTRVSVINNKLKLIIQHINDYNQMFNKTKFNPNNENTYMNLYPNNPLNDNYKQLKIETDSLTYRNEKSRTNRNNNFNNYFTNPSDNLITNNRFNDFYRLYTPNILDNKINSDFSHTFFNSKKNTDFLSYRFNTRINPKNHSDKINLFGNNYSNY